MKDEFVGGDPIPPGRFVIEVRVDEIAKMFNTIDPSPFRERDLAPSVDEFIVSWAKDAPRAAAFGLVVHLDQPIQRPEAAALRNAIHQHFSEQASTTRRQLKALFQRGRLSLLIGLAFLGGALVASRFIETFLAPGGMVHIVRESLSIGGWVAMWRPMEIFLYDWWPVRADARLYDRLAAMPVSIRQAPAV